MAECADLAQAAIREGPDADPFPRVEPIDERDEWFDAGVGLRVDVQSRLRPAEQQFVEAGDPHAAIAEREAAPSVWGERPAGVRGLDLSDRQLRDLARLVGGGV